MAKNKSNFKLKSNPQINSKSSTSLIPATICLNIIVKNESKVIERMMNSVVSLIDCYCVIDTGSTDGTQEIIKRFFESKGIPGVVINHQWKNFEDARNFAKDEGKKYIKENNFKNGFLFWIDADEQLIISPKLNINLFKHNLCQFDGGNIEVVYGGQNYLRMQFFSVNKPWRWYGPVHEVLVCDEQNVKIGLTEGIQVHVTPDGNSWTSETQQQKYEGHAKILLDYVNNDPKKDPRWVFYLAQSYRDANTEDNKKQAIYWYQKRSEMHTGFWEEIYFSKLMVASLKASLEGNYSIDEIISDYIKCGKYNIYRIEHIIPVINYYHSIKEFDIAYIYSSHAMKYAGKLPTPYSSLFIDSSSYIWKIYDLHILSCFYSNRLTECKETFSILWKLLEKGIVPESEKQRLTENRKHILEKCK